MKNTKLQNVLSEELKVMGESLIRISQALNVDETVINEPVPTKKETVDKKEEPKVEKAEPKTEEVKSEVTYTEADLNAMKYNDIKKLAKELGLNANGAKNMIVARILEHLNGEVKTEEVQEEKEEAVVATETEAPEESEEEDEEDNDDEDVSDEEMDEETLADRIEAELKDYSVEEIGDLLDSVGISPKGKRQALIAKVVKAVEEGLIALDDSNEEEEAPVENEEAPETPEDNGDESEDTDEGAFLLEARTKVRKQAIKDIMEEVQKAVDNGEYSDKEIDEALNEFYLPHEGYSKKLPKEEKIEMLKELYARMIDDEGENHDFGENYFINDEPVCCGHILNYDEDKEEYVCSVCTTKYDAE